MTQKSSILNINGNLAGKRFAKWQERQSFEESTWHVVSCNSTTHRHLHNI